MNYLRKLYVVVENHVFLSDFLRNKIVLHLLKICFQMQLR